MRDDFTQQVKEILARRVGSRCSNPDCRQLTYGPHEEPNKAVNIGVAAHITAAAPGGKRYDPNLSPEERKSIENGIWLCQNCGKLIDSDEQKYSVELLLNWKQDAEQRASLELESKGTGSSVSPASSLLRFKKYLYRLSNQPQCYWLDDINESTWYEFELFTKVDEESGQPEKPPGKVLKPILKAIRDSKNQAILITGEPGAGKSTLLEKLAVKAASEAQQDVNAPIPILVRLKDYTAGGERPGIRGLIQASLESHDPSLDVEAMNQLLQSEHVLLLIDGWNELSDEQAKSKIKTFCRPYSMIVTSRNTGDYWEIKQKFEIQPLSRNDVKHFFDERLPNTERKQLQLLADRVKDFGRTPLMVWMLYSIFKATGSTPETRGQAYYAFTELYLERAKKGIDLEEAQLALGQLAFNMMQSRKPNDPTDFALDISEIDARRLLGSDAQLKKVRNHLLRWQDERNPKISFCHQTLQEYYAAVHLLNTLMQHQEWLEKEKGQKYTYFQQEYLNYLKWTEPIALMLGLLSDPKIALAVVKQALNVDLMLGARLAGEVRVNFQEEAIKFIIQFIDEKQLIDCLRVQLLVRTQSTHVITPLLKLLKKSPSKLEDLIEILHGVTEEYPFLELLGVLENEDLIECSDAEGLSKSNLLEQNWEPSQTLEHQCFNYQNTTNNSSNKQNNSNSSIANLLVVLESKSSWDRITAAEALGNIGSVQAITGLLKALEDESSQVRQSASVALGKIGSDQAIPALIKMMEAQDDAELLNMLGTSGFTINVCRIAAVTLANIRSAQAILALLEALRHKHYYVRREAVQALGMIRSSDIVPNILEALEDRHYDVREGAAKALGSIGSDLAIPGLLIALEDEETNVREGAMWSLVQIGAEEGMPGLLLALQDEDPYVCWNAATVLGRLTSKQAIPGLLKALKHEEFDVGASAAEALGNYKDDCAAHILPNLVALLTTKSGEHAFAAIRGIQVNCKFYNYDIFQTIQKGSQTVSISQSSKQGDIHVIHRYEVNTEVFQVIEHNDGNIIGKQTQ